MDIRALFTEANRSLKMVYGYIRKVNIDDYDFITKLFSHNDIKYYYVLREDHADNLFLFTNYLINDGLNYIIENKNHQPMGLFTCEFRKEGNDINGYVSYAILPEFRGRELTENTLKTFCAICKDSQLANLALDICMSNEASTAIAQKCGFTDVSPYTGQRVGFIDPDRMEMGMRKHWYFNLHQQMSQREILCRQAMQAYQVKDYESSISLFLQALQKECLVACPFSDAQIFANIAMSYSSVQEYTKAYQCLVKAMQGGIKNDAVLNELNWLMTNVPWACK